MPCIADTSKFRTIARVSPPLSGALKLLEPLFPRARYFEKIGALIIQKGNMLITIYSTGNVTMTMIKNEQEAKDLLDDLKKTINGAITKGATPVPREKVKVDHAEIYQYLPKTDCGICGEQSCYSFAIRLVGRETTLDKCTPLLDAKYATNLEHLTSGLCLNIFEGDSVEDTDIILTDGPYISEYAEMAYKIAKAALKEHQVNIFLYLDDVHIPKLGQNPYLFANVGRLFQELAEKGAVVRACSRCAEARGYLQKEDGVCLDYYSGIKITSIYDLAEMLIKSDKVITLSR